ncbi:hypothetical protein MMC07_001817 [Pseudocyphellaria aurata]|nr:hypothetical protein [Pseudocyphellaria aurata]
MNCPSRTDEPLVPDGWNQNPPRLSADLTTREDLNGMANLRTQRSSASHVDEVQAGEVRDSASENRPPGLRARNHSIEVRSKSFAVQVFSPASPSQGLSSSVTLDTLPSSRNTGWGYLQHVGRVLKKFGKFIGPGFMVSVAYIDPGNYSTDVAAGASTRFKLLFIVLMSNVFAILLQSLAVRLGTVTGLNLAEHCRAHLPRWLNFILYLLGEGAIIATDIAEVIGSAIALNLLLKIPLVAGCALTLVDVLIILLFYNPNGSMRRLRAFEYFVMALVLGVVICFCIQLSFIENTSVGEVFKGYLPSSTIIRNQGIYLSCGILGATVMPHSLYLGSGIVQPRLRHFDTDAGIYATRQTINSDEKTTYHPSIAAIRSCLTYSTVEVGLSLFTFALFVNSAILIVAGASLSSNTAAESADLFGIHDLLSKTLAPTAGTIFALALLMSGTSAGIVATMAGQMLSEGALNWTIAPWMRRLLTRSISITPSIIIAAAVGKKGLSDALNGTQVALSVVLPFVSAPLIYFTCRNKYMVVTGSELRRDEDEDQEVETVKMRNHWLVSIFAVAIWLVIAIMNVSLLVLVGLGKA